MQTFRAYALMSKNELRRRDTLNIASNDPNVDWQLTFHDANLRDDMIDPATRRIVDRVNWSEYVNGAETIGQDMSMSYEANFPFNGLTLEVAGRLTIAQDGPPVSVDIDGIASGYWTLFFNVTKF